MAQWIGFGSGSTHRTKVEDLEDSMRNVIDVVSIVRLAVGILLIGLLLSRDVRNYVSAKKDANGTSA